MARPVVRAASAARAQRLALLTALGLLVIVQPSLAESGSARRDRAGEGASTARAYCDYVTEVAASEAALWRAPWLFSSLGTLRGNDGSVDDSLAREQLIWRLQAGLGFSPTRFYQAAFLDRQARAECDRRRAAEELRALAARPDGVTAEALSAKIEVLEQALPEAERLQEQSASELEASRTTLPEHAALVLRVDELRQRLADAALQRASLPPAPDGRRAPGSAFARLRSASARKQAAASSLRQSGALQLTLRGGYDKLFGVAQDVPVFGAVALELNPGWFWQRAHDERAERAYAELLEADVASGQPTLGELRQRLLAQRAVVRRRLAELTTVLGELSSRVERLQAEGGASAREYAGYLWFDVVRLRADQALLSRQLETLERATAGEGSEP
jgi:hypothetical protein